MCSNVGKSKLNTHLRSRNMCTLTAKCFKYMAQKKYPEKNLKNSQKLNLYAKELGYKSYNAILPTLKSNHPVLNLDLLFLPPKNYDSLDETEATRMQYPPNKIISSTIDNDLFDDVIDFMFSENYDYLLQERFVTKKSALEAKSIQFVIPSNLIATFSSHSFAYYGSMDELLDHSQKTRSIQASLELMSFNADNCFTTGASSATTDTLRYQYNKSIGKIKDINYAENIYFYVLNDIEFVGKSGSEYLLESFKVTIYAFIHYYMRYDRYSSTSLVIELPFSTQNMSVEQFHLVESIIETITCSCEMYEKIFTKPVHLDYSEFDKDMTYSYIFFTRKDIEGRISHDLRDTMSSFEV